MVCAKLLEPLYNHLTKPDLLERCTRMKTQNVKECFNSQVWIRGVNTSLPTVEIAVAMASLDFNYGAPGYSKLLEKLSIGLWFPPDTLYHQLYGTSNIKYC